MKRFLKIFIIAIIVWLIILLMKLPKSGVVSSSPLPAPTIDTRFNQYQRSVDLGLYKSMSKVGSEYLRKLHPNANTPMFRKGLETINPMMAFATTWGEAGRSHGGISLTTIMDFDPNTYDTSIDWISVSNNLEQVNLLWYLTNASHGVNTNPNSEGFGLPEALLQHPKGGSRKSSMMTGLGVGSFQITNTNWDKYNVSDRVSPIEAWKISLGLAGKGWWDNDIEPISDLTVYAALSLAHQGAALITYNEPRVLIEKINQKNVQDAFYQVGKEMYEHVLSKAEDNPSLSILDVGKNYYNRLVELSGVDFKAYHVPLGRTNKGWYVATHCLRYCFYKYYFNNGKLD